MRRAGWPFPFGVTVTFVKRVDSGRRDAQGRKVFTDEPHDVLSCATWPWGADAESGDERAQVRDMLAVAGPIDLDVTAFSAFVVDGVKYEVQGVPERWRSPLTAWGPACLMVGKVVTG